jgi:hypothetical protein
MVGVDKKQVLKFKMVFLMANKLVTCKLDYLTAYHHLLNIFFVCPVRLPLFLLFSMYVLCNS